ncbi:MAG: hypothetical protein V7K98_16120 [Nostoc sp.]|uniref:hypothetical protein n=1 Tax=Nostoc sp. TaxID=1180 RepID=UPI002FFA07A6
MGHGDKGDEGAGGAGGDEGAGGERINAQYPMPHSQCPMPHSLYCFTLQDNAASLKVHKHNNGLFEYLCIEWVT